MEPSDGSFRSSGPESGPDEGVGLGGYLDEECIALAAAAAQRRRSGAAAASLKFEGEVQDDPGA